MSSDEAVAGIQQLNIADNELMVANADNVGDTTYSATWILRRLMTLSKINEEQWSTDLETELCYLWDMTTEKDIVDFLCQNDFLSIAEFVIDNAPEPRCREIIVGILGNLSSQPTTFTRITNTPTLVIKLLNLMSSDDTETLIQVLRVLQAGSRDMQINITSPWREYLLYSKPLADALTFIFNSSTNSQLLTSALALMQSIATNTVFLNEILEVNTLLVALVETFNQLMPEQEQEQEDAEDDDNELQDQVVIDNWLEIVLKIIERQSTTRINNHQNIIRVLMRILGKLEENMIPMDDNKASSIYDCLVIINWFKKHRYHVDINMLCPLTKIMIKLDNEITSHADNDNETMIDLLKYLHKYWLDIYGSEEDIIDDYLSTCPPEVSRYLFNYIFNGTTHYNKF